VTRPLAGLRCCHAGNARSLSIPRQRPASQRFVALCAERGEHSVAVLLEAGLPPGEIGEFIRTGVLRGPKALSESAVTAEPS
jgi:hypothetical protein